MSLDDIWYKAQHDDVTAFEFLHHLIYPDMCQYASQILNNKCIAEEVVQDVFLKVWNKRKNIFSQNGSIKKYFFRIVHNQCLDILRKSNTHRELFIQLLPSEIWANISEKYSFDESMIEQLEAEDTAARIQQIIAQLPAQCREIFIKSRFENKSNREIATEMKLSENTVKTHIYRALKKMREHLFMLF